MPYTPSSVAFIRRIELPPAPPCSLGTAHASAQSLKSIDSWEKKRETRKENLQNEHVFFLFFFEKSMQAGK